MTAERRGADSKPWLEWSVASSRHVLRWIDRHAGFGFASIALAAFLGLLYMGRGGSFYLDEWAFIGVGGLGSLEDWFRPYNEHWTTVPFAIYRVLLLTVGLHSYLPYLAVLLSLHVAASAAVFVLLRQASGSFVALLGSTLFLLLGSGSENLFWAFQVCFVTSLASGLWALVALDRDRPGLAAALLIVSVASSAIGLAMLVVAGAQLAQDRARWHQVSWLAAVAGAFTVWFLAIGSTGLAGHAFSTHALTNCSTSRAF